MSDVALHRYETLYGNDPSIVKRGKDPNYTAIALGKTMFQGVADPILVFARIIFNGSNNPPSATGGDIMPTTAECALYRCVQTFDTYIQNGVLNQTTVGSGSNSSALDTSDVHLHPNSTRMPEAKAATTLVQ